MLFKKKRTGAPAFDRTGKIPVIRASICTGEQVAGFKDTVSGKFTEVMLIRTGRDLREFRETYGVREDEIKREW